MKILKSKVLLGGIMLDGHCMLPGQPKAIVLFLNSGSSSLNSMQNRRVAREIALKGFASLNVSLLTLEEEIVDLKAKNLRFNTRLLCRRIGAVTDRLSVDPGFAGLGIHYYAVNVCAAAAIMAAARRPAVVRSMVLRSGRADLSGGAIARAKVPALFIVGGKDYPLIDINTTAAERYTGKKKLVIVKNAARNFATPRALSEVVRLTGQWLDEHTPPAPVAQSDLSLEAI